MRLPHPLTVALPLLTALSTMAASETRPSGIGSSVLWYQHPATQWVEALPVGNGRLGAMVFGGIVQERLQLNEDTLWAGGPYNPANPEAAGALLDIRRLIAAGEYKRAQDLAQEKFMARPIREMPYQTVGDLIITMPAEEAARNYRRELDLDTAVARTEFQIGNTVQVREVFASSVDQVIVFRLSAREAKHTDRPASVSLTLAMQSPQRVTVRTEGENILLMEGTGGDANGVKGVVRFETRARVVTDGKVTADAAQLHVEGASSVTILVAAATSFRHYDDVGGDPAGANARALAAVEGKSFEALREIHVAEHRRLFRRVTLDLGRNEEAEKLPTDERVRNPGRGSDPSLAALYFQYGRYLLISSSRPGSQPANLQGLWNDTMNPPWGSKYTININTEMNYWPAETTNLSECAEPLFSMVRDLSETGARLAREHYGVSRGWVAHHNTDLWRATGPIDGAVYGTWPMGGAWLSVHLWEHYLFTGDRAFLAKAYPILKGSAEFFLETLVAEPVHGWLLTSPSMSPEHNHHPGVSIAAAPAMDRQILRDLFGACIESARIMGTDAEFAAKLAAARDRLPPDRIGQAGQLQEWLDDWDVAAPEQQHRHVSHLYACFPSNQITLRGTPELAAAAKKTLETRGDISTGWAIAWRLNLWARLHDAERTHRILCALLSPERTYPNLFDAHPPFQIDGNFGGTSAIAEMLLQSHVRVPSASGEPVFEIELLPALPHAWAAGSVTGLRARGGFETAIAWRGGRLVSARIRAISGGSAVLRYDETTRAIALKAGESFEWDGRR